jgi:Hg(II)-responsive transcriptional regulator
MMKGLTIGKLAKGAGVTVDTVRFYERRGLIAEPARTHANYRLYPPEDVALLKFIKKSKDLGFSLNEIKELLVLRHDPDTSRAEVKARFKGKITDIKNKMTDLAKMLETLQRLADSCDGQGSVAGCHIIEALNEDTDGHHHH